MPLLRTWFVFVALMCFGPSAQAAEIGPVARFERAGITVVPNRVPDLKAPRLASAYGRSSPLALQFHVGQGVGAVLLGASAAGLALGGVAFSEGGYGIYSGVILWQAANIVGAIGAGAALGANAALLRDGLAGNAWAGTVAVAAGGIGLVTLLLTPFVQPMVAVGVVTAPIVLVGGVTQLVLNGVNGRPAKAGLAVVPIEEGAVPTFTFRF